MLSLERDIDNVEKRLIRASEEQAITMAEMNRLKKELEDSNDSNYKLKRRLEALGGDSRNGYGLSSGGLHLNNLDLVDCCVTIKNTTNMDVSLDGWTVRVISGNSISNSSDGQSQADGMMVKSPLNGEGGRRDSIVRRRHAFIFPFDFMLAAGSDAIVR